MPTGRAAGPRGRRSPPVDSGPPDGEDSAWGTCPDPVRGSVESLPESSGPTSAGRGDPRSSPGASSCIGSGLSAAARRCSSQPASAARSASAVCTEGGSAGLRPVQSSWSDSPASAVATVQYGPVRTTGNRSAPGGPTSTGSPSPYRRIGTFSSRAARASRPWPIAGSQPRTRATLALWRSRTAKSQARCWSRLSRDGSYGKRWSYRDRPYRLATAKSASRRLASHERSRTTALRPCRSAPPNTCCTRNGRGIRRRRLT